MSAGIYIHIPFCHHKCGYCDFYSSTNAEQFEDAFVEALIKDLNTNSHLTSGSIDTIFLGGGTPSMIKTAHLDRIMTVLQQNYTISNSAEITIETNPGTVDSEKLRDFKSMGINRISFGVQSFHENELVLMERIHSADTAKKNIFEARNVGFENISLDLIFALPNQTFSQWKENLSTAMDLDIDHISAYNLIFEKNTPFKVRLKNGEFQKQSEENERKFYEYTINFLAENGFHQYEISNFAKSKSLQSQHNLKYWTHDQYLGFGPSAHSFDGIKTRNWRIKSTEKYIDYIHKNETPVTGSESLSRSDLMFETVMLGLRLIRGIDINKFNKRFNTDFEETYSETLSKFKQMGLLVIDNSFCKLTKEGIFYCDEIITHFV